MNEPNAVLQAHMLIQRLARAGVDTWCVAPGGRNAPIGAMLGQIENLTVFDFFEERSAAFFALGRARTTERPVVVCTTSGTAAAEAVPAAIEAHYTMTPLVVVTADRPHRLRGSGAPQAIDQSKLFAGHAPLLDLDHDDAIEHSAIDRFLADWSGGPIHINIAFNEPLLDPTDRHREPIVVTVGDDRLGAPESTEAAASLQHFLQEHERPLVLVGALAPNEVAPARDFIARLGAPAVVECLSQLREDPTLASCRLDAPDRSIRALIERAEVDSVVRLGGIPTHRIWRDLDATCTLPVCSVSALPFAGLTRGTMLQASLADTLSAVERATPVPAWTASRDSDVETARSVDALLDREPRSEPALVRALSGIADGQVYLGNSLPIREWDAFAGHRHIAGRRIHASRGANGIDGQLSTALGIASATEAGGVWAVVGDLTALYDLAAPWILRALDASPIRIVVINNGGGRIFDRVFGLPDFRNAHGLDFSAWAAMWRLEYRLIASPDELTANNALPDRAVIEVRPDESATERFWHAYDELIRS